MTSGEYDMLSALSNYLIDLKFGDIRIEPRRTYYFAATGKPKVVHFVVDFTLLKIYAEESDPKSDLRNWIGRIAKKDPSAPAEFGIYITDQLLAQFYVPRAHTIDSYYQDTLEGYFEVKVSVRNKPPVLIKRNPKWQ